MALETPDYMCASAVVLLQNLFDPGEETLEFRNNTGFSAVAFVDPEDPSLGMVFDVLRPVNNDEGSVYVGGDLFSGANDAVGWITPMHFKTGLSEFDDLDPNRVVVILDIGKESAFRFYLQLMRVATEVEPIAGEPLDPPAPPP